MKEEVNGLLLILLTGLTGLKLNAWFLEKLYTTLKSRVMELNADDYTQGKDV